MLFYFSPIVSVNQLYLKVVGGTRLMFRMLGAVAKLTEVLQSIMLKGGLVKC
jgi:hypothetical protein